MYKNLQKQLHGQSARSIGSRRRGWRRGGTLVESALGMTLLLTLTFGIIEYGYYIYIKSTAQNAARAGARIAILSTADNTQVSSAVSTALTNAGMTPGNFTVTTNPASISGLTSGVAATVTLTYTWGTVGVTPLPVVLGGIPSSKSVSVSVTMYTE